MSKHQRIDLIDGLHREIDGSHRDVMVNEWLISHSSPLEVLIITLFWEITRLRICRSIDDYTISLIVLDRH